MAIRRAAIPTHDGGGMMPGRVRALAVGTLAVGTLDILAAFLVATLLGGAPVRVLKGIAGGVLGPAAREGGAGVAALGLLLHFTVACGVVAAYHFASRRLPDLRERPLLWGPIYGVVVYAVMNAVVVPLSAITPGAPATPAILRGLLIHVAFVGLPAALSSRLLPTHATGGDPWTPSSASSAGPSSSAASGSSPASSGR